MRSVFGRAVVVAGAVVVALGSAAGAAAAKPRPPVGSTARDRDRATGSAG